MRGEARGDRQVIEAKVASVAKRHNGVAGRAELLRAGVSPRAVERRVNSGALIELHRGVYLVASPLPPPLHLESAALLAAGPDAAISHFAAAGVRSLDVPSHLLSAEDGKAIVDVTLPGAKRRPRKGLRIHSRPLASWEVALVGSLRVTTAARTILDLVPSLTDRELEQLVAEALRNNRVRRRDLEVQIERSKGRTGVKRLRRLLELGRLRMTRSGGEELLLETLRAAGIEPPLTNERVEGRELDAYWPVERVGIELQSREWHSSAEALEADSEKASLLAALGYTLLPFTVKQVADQPDLVVARTRAALENARREGPDRDRPEVDPG